MLCKDAGHHGPAAAPVPHSTSVHAHVEEGKLDAHLGAAARGGAPYLGAVQLKQPLPQSLAGGVIFGWQALLPVLYDYGVFAESCKGSDEAYPCLKMRSKLALVFSIAVSERPLTPSAGPALCCG